uniref:Uncharacterized protein n=1 Tax=Fagus sylvatica TaxID=28930 RepID=A0A2N9HU79_FAGSY
MLRLFYVSHAISGHIKAVLLTYAESKLYATSTPSTSPILLKSINPIPDFVKSVFRKWTQTMAFTIAQDAILLSTFDCAMDKENREELKDEDSTE